MLQSGESKGVKDGAWGGGVILRGDGRSGEGGYLATITITSTDASASTSTSTSTSTSILFLLHPMLLPLLLLMQLPLLCGLVRTC